MHLQALMDKNDLIKRTKEFAHRCVKLAISLPKNYLGNHIKGKLIQCGSSVTANYKTDCLGISQAAFVSKLSIVIEEADVRRLADWLEFIIDEKLNTWLHIKK